MNRAAITHCRSTAALGTAGVSTSMAGKSLEPILHLENRNRTVHSSTVSIGYKKLSSVDEVDERYRKIRINA